MFIDETLMPLPNTIFIQVHRGDVQPLQPQLSLREKYPNTELSSGPYFPVFGLNTDIYSKSPYSVRIQENTDQKKHRIWTLLTQCVSTISFF